MKIKAVRFAQGVRCGKGSMEEMFIDVTTENKSPYSLELDEPTGRITIFNSMVNKTIVVYPTNIAYFEPLTKVTVEPATKRTSKAVAH